ncbi:hypothetical protein AHAS_Ahas20G0124000 [Arachis hypogaea]
MNSPKELLLTNLVPILCTDSSPNPNFFSLPIQSLSNSHISTNQRNSVGFVCSQWLRSRRSYQLTTLVLLRPLTQLLTKGYFMQQTIFRNKDPIYKMDLNG